MRLKIFLITLFVSLFCTSVIAKELLSSWDDLTLVGGFKVPVVQIDTANTVAASGSFDKRPGTVKWIANHSSVGNIIEFTEPSEPSMAFPTLIEGRHGLPFVGNANLTARGVQWIDADNVLVSGRYFYSSASTYNWIANWNLETGVETLYEVGHVDETSDWAEGSSSNKLFHLHQAFGAGFVRVAPDWLAGNGYPADSIGLAAGGYDVITCSMGPAAAVWSIGDTLPTTLLDYPILTTSSDGANHFEIRDKNYSYPLYGPEGTYPWPIETDTPSTPLGMWRTQPDLDIIQTSPQVVGPTGSTGYFLGDEVSHGAGWIDDSNYKGLVYGVTHPNGYLDYDAQGAQEGAGEMFLAYDPSTFYNDTGSHYPHDSAFAGGPAGSYSHSLYVYDPDCLAQVGSGAIDEWECTPTIITPDFSNLPETPTGTVKNPTEIGGVFWDEDRGYLWLVLTRMSSGNLYPILAAYTLNGTAEGTSSTPYMPRHARIGGAFYNITLPAE